MEQAAQAIRNTTAILTREIPLKEMDSALLALAVSDYFKNNREAQEAVEAAVYCATIWHSKQTREMRCAFRKTPYIEHPLRNALRLLRAGVASSDIIIACVLHDTLEDTREEIMQTALALGIQEDTPEQVIAEMFSEDVAHLVKSVTNEPKTGEVDPTEKFEIYRQKISSVVEEMNRSGDARAFLIKLSDLVDNASSLRSAWESANSEEDKEKILKRFRKYAFAMEDVASGVSDMREYVSEKVFSEMLIATSRMLRNLGTLAKVADKESGSNWGYHVSSACKILAFA